MSEARRTGAQGRDEPPLALAASGGGGACLDWACHPDGGGRHVILLHPAANRGAEVRHRLLTYGIIKEICNAARELAGFSAPFISVLPDLFVAGDDTRPPGGGGPRVRISPSSGESRANLTSSAQILEKARSPMARLVTSSCTGTSRKLCGRSVVNWRASVHSAEAVIGVTG